MARFKNRIGEVYGKLTVIERAENSASGKARWLCRCECGREAVKFGDDLNSGRSKDCGNHRGTHRRSGTQEYRSWCMMKHRCNNPNYDSYHNYGGRGITVCDRWQNSFENFLADMGERPSKTHTLERIDNSGNYEPGNCKWATRAEQLRNNRCTIMLTYKGVERCLSDTAKVMGIPRSTLAARVRRQGKEDAVAEENYKWQKKM